MKRAIPTVTHRGPTKASGLRTFGETILAALVGVGFLIAMMNYWPRSWNPGINLTPTTEVSYEALTLSPSAPTRARYLEALGKTGE